MNRFLPVWWWPCSFINMCHTGLEKVFSSPETVRVYINRLPHFLSGNSPKSLDRQNQLRTVKMQELRIDIVIKSNKHGIMNL